MQQFAWVEIDDTDDKTLALCLSSPPLQASIALTARDARDLARSLAELADVLESRR